MAKISLIAALSDNGVIGSDGAIPWRIKADFQYFKAMTLGKPCIMGRKTFESIGKPLPDRQNIILTRDKSYTVDGADVVHSLEESLKVSDDAEEIMICGGHVVYEMFLPQADILYLTEVHMTVEGDTKFPEVDKSQWKEISREKNEAGEKYPAFDFVRWERC